MISIIIPNNNAFPQMSNTNKIRKVPLSEKLPRWELCRMKWLYNFNGKFLSADKPCSRNSPGECHKRGHYCY